MSLAPYGYLELKHLDRQTAGPISQVSAGYRPVGRDLLSRLIFGARVSLCLSVWQRPLLVLSISSLIGGVSGFLGGKLDLVVQRFVDAWMAFPGLLLLLTIMSIAGKGLPQIILVLGISGGIGGSKSSPRRRYRHKRE